MVEWVGAPELLMWGGGWNIFKEFSTCIRLPLQEFVNGHQNTPVRDTAYRIM